MSDPAPSHGHSHGEAHASRPPAHLNMGAEMAFDHTTYDDHSMTAVLAREQANALRRKGVKGSLLDFGTGTGNVAIQLRDVASDITGVDISQGMVDTFNQKAEQLKSQGGPPMRAVLCPEDISTLADSLGQPYDNAFSCLVYHHIERPVETTLALVRAVKPGGRVFIVDFAAMSPEKNAALLRDMAASKADDGGKNEQGGHGRGHAHGHDHSHGPRHDHGNSHSHAHGSSASSHEERFSHLRGYTTEQVRAWFTFPTDAGVAIADLFYERAFSSAFVREGGEEIEMFIAGATRV